MSCVPAILSNRFFSELVWNFLPICIPYLCRILFIIPAHVAFVHCNFFIFPAFTEWHFYSDEKYNKNVKRDYCIIESGGSRQPFTCQYICNMKKKTLLDCPYYSPYAVEINCLYKFAKNFIWLFLRNDMNDNLWL